MDRSWLVIPVLTLAVASPAGAEQTYRWKDESGRTHFSNVGPVGEEVVPEGERREPEEREATGEGPDAAAAAGTGERRGGTFGELSDDSFSTTVSRKRGELQSRLRSAERELRGIDSELASIRRHRDRAYEAHASQLQGVTRPDAVPSDDEKDLLERKKKLEEEITGIRKSYDELRDAASQRYGSVPGWWRPLD